MNRQTLAVTIGTVALLLIAVILLYATPSPEPNPPVRNSPKATLRSKAAKAKNQQQGRLKGAQLIHKRAIPDDRPAAPEGAPNVVVVFMSTQRRDQWSLYGGPQETTPFLASQVEAHGAQMADALAVAVSPHEAAVTLVTGKYPHELQAIEPGPRRNGRPVPKEANTLAEVLADSGWFTVGVSANHHLNRRMGHFQGFNWYRDSQPFSLMLDRRIPAEQVVRFAIRRVADRTEAESARPLYLQLAFVDSHKPFKIPAKEYQPFEGPNHKVAPYRSTIRKQDNALSTLTLGLAQEGITVDNTVFVVVADHGEGLAMPEHHRQQHGYVLYPSSVEIPWVAWGAGITTRGAIEGLASAVDVAPTVVGLAGLSTGEGGFTGLDLSAAFQGKQAQTSRQEAYAATVFRGANRGSLWTANRQCQKDFGSTHQLPGDEFPDACFDRKADPTFLNGIEDATLTSKLVSMHEKLMAQVAKPEAAGP